MEHLDKKVTLIANNTNAALELKKKLVDKGLIVNHIYTGSSVPILFDQGYFYSGAGNIRRSYNIK